MHVAITFLNITCRLFRPPVDFKNTINSTRGQYIEYIKWSLCSDKFCYNANYKCFKCRVIFLVFQTLPFDEKKLKTYS